MESAGTDLVPFRTFGLMDRELNAHINLRLPQQDLERLKQEAERSCRSLQGEIRYRLKQSLIEQEAL